jgi:hypothetical protein
LLALLRLFFFSRAALIAENLFLRRQLALFKERKVKPRRITTVARFAMIALARCFDWRDALVIVKPETFIKWHRAFCERLVGTIRRECLDYLIPCNERHLRRVLSEFVVHYNRGRPHSSLGPGIPEPPQDSVPASGHRHKLPDGYRIRSKSVVGGLHHEYSLGKEAA